LYKPYLVYTYATACPNRTKKSAPDNPGRIQAVKEVILPKKRHKTFSPAF